MSQDIYAPVEFTGKNGGPLTVNAAAVVAIHANSEGISNTTVIRTKDGGVHLVRESYEKVREKIAAAFAPAEAKPLELTRKGKGEK